MVPGLGARKSVQLLQKFRTPEGVFRAPREALEGAIRRGPPTLFSVHAAQAAPDSVGVTIHDDAPSERRRRSIEVLEERARTLGAALSVAYDDDGTTMRLQLPTYAASD